MTWCGGLPIYYNGTQVAEIVRSQGQHIIRNLRPNGTIGVCWRGPSHEVRAFLDTKWPGWRQ
jgi:hypothetical protein